MEKKKKNRCDFLFTHFHTKFRRQSKMTTNFEHKFEAIKISSDKNIIKIQWNRNEKSTRMTTMKAWIKLTPSKLSTILKIHLMKWHATNERDLKTINLSREWLSFDVDIAHGMLKQTKIKFPERIRSISFWPLEFLCVVSKNKRKQLNIYNAA